MTSSYQVFDSTMTVQHSSWVPLLDDGGDQVTDNHGNDMYQFLASVTRPAVCYYPLHKIPHHDIVGDEYLSRTMIDFILEVPDASIYHKGDRVVLDGQMYTVQGYPFNWGAANPFGFDTSYFGGSVHIEKVT